MKVAFLISSKGHGRGGHFYSLKATANALSSRLDPVIVNVGLTQSPVLNSFSGMKLNVLMKDNGLRQHVKSVESAVRQLLPDVIHTFDLDALYFGRVVAKALRRPLVHTKCGGAVPKLYFPKVDELIVYSQDDVRWFSNSYRHRRTRVAMIPNRVTADSQDAETIALLRERLDEHAFVILRICRVGSYYRRSLIQAATLVRRLRTDGVRAQLLVVGVLQEAAVRDEVQGIAGASVVFATEQQFTVGAARIIDVADAVVGTGRGFMEAAILGKLMLAPTADTSIPILVDENRVEQFLTSNFSERVKLGSVNENEEYQRIRDACLKRGAAASMNNGLREFAADNFDVSRRIDDYCSLYDALRYRNPATFADLILHSVLTARRVRAAKRNLGYAI